MSKMAVIYWSMTGNTQAMAEAIAAGADMNKLFNIPARERIGRAKMVPQDEVVAAFDGIIDEMKAEIAEIAEGGEDE